MSEVEIFTYTNYQVRTIMIDNQAWFVCSDVCTVLNIANPTQAAQSLDDDEYRLVPAALCNTEARPQDMINVISLAGLYSLILRSRKPEAKAFKRWVTHDVLPAIQKTGSYGQPAQPQIPQTYAEALQLAADQARQIESQNEQLAVAAPKVEAWDKLATATGDYAVADAAKILCRDPLISKIGQQRLFTYMGEIRWIHRNKGDRRWRVYQSAVDSGWVTELASSHYHPRTGELVLDAPQVRVTIKGLGELHKRLRHKQQPIPSL